MHGTLSFTKSVRNSRWNVNEAYFFSANLVKAHIKKVRRRIGKNNENSVNLINCILCTSYITRDITKWSCLNANYVQTTRWNRLFHVLYTVHHILSSRTSFIIHIWKEKNKNLIDYIGKSTLTDGVDDFAREGVRELLRGDHQVGYVAGYHRENPHSEVRQWRVRSVLLKTNEKINLFFYFLVFYIWGSEKVNKLKFQSRIFVYAHIKFVYI